MAAESVGLAASVAGIVSLGLQITSGIIKYADAFENRQEELESVKKQSEVLKAILGTLDTHVSSHGQSGAVPDAVVRSMQLFRRELIHLQTLHSDLSDADPAGLTSRMNNRKKRVTYAFNRSKIQELGLRLQKAGDALQLTLNVLGLQVLRQNTKNLAAVKSTSQGLSYELSLLRSELAAIEAPIVKINDELCLLRGDADSSNQLVISQYDNLSNKLQGSRNDVLHVQETIDHWTQLQSMRDQEMTKRCEEMAKNLGRILEHLQQSHNGVPSREAVIRGLAGKPAFLKELSDHAQISGQRQGQAAKPYQCARPLQKTAAPPTHRSPFKPMAGPFCTCPRLQRSTNSTWMRLEYASFSSEWETKAHWPSCPRAKLNRNRRMKIGLRYNGLALILKTAINVSFAMTSGAGGFSITPNFSCNPTVDDDLDPAFRIMELLGSVLWNNWHNSQSFIIACIRKLIGLFDDGAVCPTAVNSRNQSLMHVAASSLNLALGAHMRTQGDRFICNPFVELFQMLVSYGVEAFTFDLNGMSPLAELSMLFSDTETSQAVTNVLIEANSERLPLVLEMSCLEQEYNYVQYSIPISHVEPVLETVYECGPLGMGVTQNDVDGVEQMLKHFPGSIAEINIFGQTLFHLAGTNAAILKVLLQYQDYNILNRRDMSGFTALEAAMVRTSDYCDNGREINRCDSNACGCCRCIDLFMDAGCDIRMHQVAKPDFSPELHFILKDASELARRKYVYYMKRSRDCAIQRRSLGAHAETESIDSDSDSKSEPGDAEKNASPSLKQRKPSTEPDAADDMGWIFLEICDPHLAGLFYRRGFRVHPSCLCHLSCITLENMSYAYIDWLVSHGADPFFRSTRGPVLTKNSPNIGFFGAHCTFQSMSLYGCVREHDLLMPDAGSWDRYMALTANIFRRKLTDGCRCHCTLDGCSPFTLLMRDVPYAVFLLAYYRVCGTELTLLTYKAAIRYATFKALDLFHTCCKAMLPYRPGNWVESDDVDLVNKEQASLLEMFEDLVKEFEEAALGFLGTDSNGRSLFSQFWVDCWQIRIEEELEKLNGAELTDAERHGAEAIGVHWVVSEQETEENPYHEDDLEYWFYELDQICPEYVEPWPEDLRRISELS